MGEGRGIYSVAMFQQNPECEGVRDFSFFPFPPCPRDFCRKSRECSAERIDLLSEHGKKEAGRAAIAPPLLFPTIFIVRT